MRLDLELRIRAGQGGAGADVGDGPMLSALDRSVDGVNAGGWNGQSGHVQVCGGKTQLPSQPVSANDLCGERIGAAERLAGGIEIAGANGFANPRAADHLSIERNRGQPVDEETQLLPEAFEQLNIPASFVADGERAAKPRAVKATEVPSRPANK